MRTTSLSSRVRALRTQRWTACAMIVLYMLGISGLPAGPGAIKIGCQCDKILQETGSCCCRKKTTALAKNVSGSCCALKTTAAKPGAKSCCSQAKESRSSDKTTVSDRDFGPVSVTACSCDSPADAGFLLNCDPRVLAETSLPFPGRELTSICPLLNQVPQSRSIAPETPPPRLRSC